MSKFRIVVLIVVALFALTACQTQSPTEAATPTNESTAEGDVEVVALAEPAVNECLNCHTDKQRLIDTGKPVVAAESESKGVG